MELLQGQHLVCPRGCLADLQELYEGYIAEPSLNANDRDGWRSTYAVVASSAGHWEVARNKWRR